MATKPHEPADIYRPSQAVGSIAKQYLTNGRKPAGLEFERDMAHMQRELLEHHAGRMTEADRARARRTMVYLEREIACPGQGGCYDRIQPVTPAR